MRVRYFLCNKCNSRSMKQFPLLHSDLFIRISFEKCYFHKLYNNHTRPKGNQIVLALGCLYKFRMEFYILDHCDCCCPHDHTTLYKSKSSRSGTLASTIWKKKVYELRWLHCMLQKNTKFKGISVTKGMYFSSDINRRILFVLLVLVIISWIWFYK